MLQVGASRPCSANFTRSTLCALIVCNSWRRARSKNTVTSLIVMAASRDCSAKSSSSWSTTWTAPLDPAPLNELIFSLFTWIFVFFLGFHKSTGNNQLLLSYKFTRKILPSRTRNKRRPKRHLLPSADFFWTFLFVSPNVFFWIN